MEWMFISEIPPARDGKTGGFHHFTEAAFQLSANVRLELHVRFPSGLTAHDNATVIVRLCEVNLKHVAFLSQIKVDVSLIKSNMFVSAASSEMSD